MCKNKCNLFSLYITIRGGVDVLWLGGGGGVSCADGVGGGGGEFRNDHCLY